MKTERARELYSDYAEGILSPALAQALEQHFEADPDARADYEQFQQMYALLDTPQADEVEVPLGFRAKVLELAAQEHARREAAPTRRATLSLREWFGGLSGQRRASVGAVLAFAVVALAAVLVHQETGDTVQGGFGLIPTTSTLAISATAGSGTTHLFHIHLPANIKQATVMAYVLTSVNQIADPTTGMSALAQPQHLTNDEELQIPVTLLKDPTPGTTLDLFVQWTPDQAGQTPGKQVVFTPLQQGAAPTANAQPPVNGNFFSALEGLAAQYDVTVIADASATPNAAITLPPAGDDALTALQAVATQAGYKASDIGNGAYQVYRQ